MHGTKSLLHLRTRLICPEISFEKVRNIFLQDFKDLCTENWGICRGKQLRQQTNRYFSILN